MTFAQFSAFPAVIEREESPGKATKIFKFDTIRLEGWYYSNFKVTLTQSREIPGKTVTTFVATWENGSTGWSTNASAWLYELLLQGSSGADIWAIALGYDRIQTYVERNKKLQGNFDDHVVPPYKGNFPAALFDAIETVKVFSSGDYVEN